MINRKKNSKYNNMYMEAMTESNARMKTVIFSLNKTVEKSQQRLL